MSSQIRNRDCQISSSPIKKGSKAGASRGKLLRSPHLLALPYALILLFPISLALAIPIGGLAFSAPLIVYFVIVSLADHLFGNGNPIDAEKLEHAPVFQMIVTAYGLSQVAMLAWGIVIFDSLQLMEQVLFTLSFGAILSGAAICCAHELLHKPRKSERFLGQLLLVLTNYGSFAIDHIYIHHNPRITATDADTSFSKRGQTSYSYVFKAAIGSAIEAYHLEQRRLKTDRFSLKNRVTFYYTLSTGIAVAILVLFGPMAAVFYIFQGFLGVWTLWMTGYLQHYGLRRGILPSGKQEPLSPANCWDCDRYASNYFLFNLPRHSQHHKTPTKNYQSQQGLPAQRCDYHTDIQ